MKILFAVLILTFVAGCQTTSQPGTAEGEPDRAERSTRAPDSICDHAGGSPCERNVKPNRGTLSW